MGFYQNRKIEKLEERVAKLEYDANLSEENDAMMMRDIEYYQARIAELERELSERPVVALLSDIARIAALEAALLPFAAIADDSTDNLADNYMYPDCYPMSAFRAARAALKKNG